MVFVGLSVSIVPQVWHRSAVVPYWQGTVDSRSRIFSRTITWPSAVSGFNSVKSLIFTGVKALRMFLRLG